MEQHKLQNLTRSYFKLCGLLIFIFLSTTKVATAQKNDNLNNLSESNNKNSVYLTFSHVILSSQISLSYERTLFQKESTATKLKVVAGKYLSNNGDYEEGTELFENYAGLGVVQLIDIFEIGAGIAYSNYSTVDYSQGSRIGLNEKFSLFGNVGVRHESNDFIVRGGLGNIELLYLSLGFKF